MGHQFIPGLFSVLASAPPAPGGPSAMWPMLGLAGAVGLGLVLWARGAGLMKWATAVVGVALGVGLGVAAAAIVPGAAAAGLTPMWGALGGGLVGMVAGLALCRAITAGACGLVGAGLGLVVAGVALERGWAAPRESHSVTVGNDGEESASEAVRDEDASRTAVSGSVLERLLAHEAPADAQGADRSLLREAMGRPEVRERAFESAWSVGRERIMGSGEEGGAPGALPASLRPHVEAAGERLRGLSERAAAVWTATAPGARPVWLIGAAVGWALGMLLALAMPRHGTMAASSAVGAALVLTAGGALSAAAGWGWLESLGGAPWALAWLGAAVLGALVQWSGVVGPRAKVAAKAG